MGLEQYKELVGNTATVITILNFLVGSQVCYGFIKKKTTGDVSGLTFLVGVMMTFSWWSYGRIVSDGSITLVNGVGLVLQTLYSVVYYVYTNERAATTKKTLLTIGFILTLKVSIERFEPSLVQYRLGLLCATMSVLYCSAPLASILEVARTGETKALPFYLILATVMMTTSWTCYGLIIKDSFVIVPNMVGCALATFQLLLFAILPSHNNTKYIV